MVSKPHFIPPARSRAVAAGLVWLGVAMLGLHCTDYGDPVGNAPPAANVVIVEPVNPTATVGDLVEFRAEARDLSGTIIDAATFTWSSSNTNVATIDTFGRATALAAGTTSIRAVSGTATSAPMLLTVTPQVATVVITEPADPTPEVEVGSFLEFAAEARDAGGSPIPGAAIAWTSSDTLVATIDATGRAVGRSAGKCAIRAASGSKRSDPDTLTVRAATQSPATIAILSPTSPADVVAGGTLQFTAEVRDTAGDPIPGAAVRWESSNPNAATIDATGLARGVAAGATDITATLDSLRSNVVQLQVTPPPVASVTVTGPANRGVTIGAMVQFTAEARDSMNVVIPGATFTWTSDNEGVATIDVNGLARGNSPGTARIRAEASGLQSPPVTLTVAPPYAVVQQIWNQFCIVCHPGQNAMSLRTGVSYSELVNHAAVGRQMLRVAPGDTTNSYLWIKLTQNCPNANCSGFRMPEFSPPLPAAQLATIRDWIMAGAPP